MFTKLDRKVASYRANKDNKHPVFVANNGLQNIVDEIEAIIIDVLPHGAGIDCDWHIEKSTGLNFTCNNAYHVLDGNGFYCGYVNFQVLFNANTKEFELSLNRENIEEIYREYTTEEPTDEFSEDPCPYLDDLDDDIYDRIQCSIEDYVLRETLAYIKENRPYLLTDFCS